VEDDQGGTRSRKRGRGTADGCLHSVPITCRPGELASLADGAPRPARLGEGGWRRSARPLGESSRTRSYLLL
jgi:hypothetical protein